MAFAIALGKDLGELQFQTVLVKIVLTIVCVVFGAAYAFAVFRCYNLAMSVNKAHETVWRQVTHGRVICISLFTIVPAFGLFARDIFGK